jgi:DNA-binding transcriptional LysR family regulator
MEVNYVPIIMALVAQGVGYTLLPRSAIVTLPKPTYTIAPLQTLSYQWVVVHSKERELSAASSALRKIMFDLSTAVGIQATAAG